MCVRVSWAALAGRPKPRQGTFKVVDGFKGKWAWEASGGESSDTASLGMRL